MSEDFYYTILKIKLLFKIIVKIIIIIWLGYFFVTYNGVEKIETYFNESVQEVEIEKEG